MLITTRVGLISKYIYMKGHNTVWLGRFIIEIIIDKKNYVASKQSKFSYNSKMPLTLYESFLYAGTQSSRVFHFYGLYLDSTIEITSWYYAEWYHFVKKLKRPLYTLVPNSVTTIFGFSLICHEFLLTTVTKLLRQRHGL